jgi:aminopeptidase N
MTNFFPDLIVKCEKKALILHNQREKMTATIQIITVTVIVMASIAYAALRIRQTLNRRHDPCANCPGCALKNDARTRAKCKGCERVLALCALLLLGTAHGAAYKSAAVELTAGVSHELAEYRARHISDVHYKLAFHIPEDQQEAVSGEETITFSWNGNDDLQLDFQGELTDEVCLVNGQRCPVSYTQEHIVIGRRFLKHGVNTLKLSFTATDKALNRRPDLLYTLFVPDHARSAFPCFDQPNLKARFTLTLQLPEGWEAISNAPLGQESDLLPTYLFSFAAGHFERLTAERDGRQLTVLYQETDAAKVAQLPDIVDEMALSIRWMEDYTGIPYPFQNYGCVVLPGYQFGGMEHPGCIQLRDKTIFLDPNPTPDERLKRLQLIAHETAHIWFGDLVTMRWFNDVWTKEVFANFMADKVCREHFPDIDHDLNFLKQHYIPAIATDRTAGTHPIQQPLDNLRNAGLLYGNIIYHKAPIMMLKLEERMGKASLRSGLQTYLRRFAFSNATWDDLIDILHAEKPEADIVAFDRQWVKNQGVPIVDIQLSEAAPLPNQDGRDYARLRLADSTAISQYVGRWDELNTPSGRLAAVMTLYENFLLHRISADFMAAPLCKLVDNEHNDLLLSSYASYLATTLRYASADLRPELEKRLWTTARHHHSNVARQSLTRLLTRNAVSSAVVDSVYALWLQKGDTLLSDADYMRAAYHLAILRPNQWKDILDTQRGRLTSKDHLREFDFVSRACNPDTLVQQQLFSSLLERENRTVEPDAILMLELLSDHQREPFNNRYIAPALEALEEIQQTNDIFFPLNWCDALLFEHTSEEARWQVQSFLESHPNLPDALRKKLLQAAFMLMEQPGIGK